MATGQRLKQIKRTSEVNINRDMFTELYMKDIKKYDLLLASEEKELIQRAQSGDKIAKEKVITSNLRFVVKCAKEYQNPNVNILDLINAGNIGLCIAVDKFDTTRDMKFISYAVWWVKKEIVEFLRDNSRSIRLPYNQQDDIFHYLKIKDLVEQKLEIPNATFEQVREHYDVVNEEIERKYQHYQEKVQEGLETGKLYEERKVKKNIIKKPIEDIFHYSIAAYGAPSSLSETVNDEDGITVEETLGTVPEIDSLFDREDKRRTLLTAIKKLNDSQRRIIEYTYGFNESKLCYSNEDIAIKLNLTAERVRQIHRKALSVLKNNNSIGKLF